MPSGNTAAPTTRPSPWAPLKHPLFASLIAAQLGSHIGSFFQVVAASWLMGDLDPSPALVALIQTASLLPVLLFGFAAGAIADIVDRRKLLITAQAWMATCAGVLAVLTALDQVTPATLLAITFAMGVGAALMGPAWQAIQPDLVPRSEFTQAVALSSVTFNMGRSVGPALGGALIAATNPAWAFAVNAVSFAGVLTVLARWKPQRSSPRLAPETLRSALRVGWRYSANAPVLRGVLVRTAAFALPAAAIQALLPAVVRDRLGMGSGAFGILLGCFGAGAVLAALLRPRLDEVLSRDAMVVVASVLIAGAIAVIGWSTSAWLTAPVLALAGASWTSATVTLNVSTQGALAWWVRARGLGLYMVVLSGGIAIGSAIWGAVASWSLPGAHFVAAATLLVGATTALKFRLGAVEALDLTPASTSRPRVSLDPGPDAGPVLVTVTYRVTEARHGVFVDLMRNVEADRRRDGASDWALYRDMADPEVFIETFAAETWGEHLRQHDRRTVTADVMMQEVRVHVEGDIRVAHLISAYDDGTDRTDIATPERD